MNYSIPHDPTYCGMYAFIHINEKWFYLTHKIQRVYFANNEPFPQKKDKVKNKIPKFMFMAIVARKIEGDNRKCEFDGKLGIFSFTDAVAVKRTSKNRVKGQLRQNQLSQLIRLLLGPC